MFRSNQGKMKTVNLEAGQDKSAGLGQANVLQYQVDTT